MGRGLALALLTMLTPALWAQEEIIPTVSEERVNVPSEPNRENLQQVKRRLSLGAVGITYEQLVDPAQGDKPLVQRYGDYRLGCAFPPYTWNWDLEYFLDVTVTRPGQPPIAANRTVLQQGIYALAQGARGVADMVWPLPPRADGGQAGELVVRLVKLVAEPEWLYVRVTIEGEADAQITAVKLHSYPTTTSGPPERQRWVTSLATARQMANGAQRYTPAEEWGLVLHNRLAQEDGGALLVMDPDQVATGDVSGTYAVIVHMNTKPTQSMNFAMGYFWDKPQEQAIADFRATAPQRLQALRAVDWNVPVDAAAWTKEKQQITDLLAASPAARAKYEAEWQALAAEGDKAIGGSDPGAGRRVVLLVRRARQLRAQLYEPALQALIEAATR